MTPLDHFNTPAIRPPFAFYSHGVAVAAGARMLFCSGQLGIAPDDTVPEDALEQARLCFFNIGAVLAEAGMTWRDLVRLNAYVTDRAFLGDYMRARDEFIDGADAPPASTLMIVGGFARAEFKVEVEAIAAGQGEILS
jgi:enamine deaminase RidA (YjgF/YER057c/UK114 family)